MKAFRPVLPVLTLAVLVAAATNGARAAAPAGTSITNVASATYADANGLAFATVSNTVAATIAAVTAVGVTPNENGCNAQTDGFPLGTNVTRTFVVTNTSNVSDAYALAATTSAGSIVQTAVTSGGTSANATPTLAPGASVQVAVIVATANVAVGTDIAIALRATSTFSGAANGQATATATQCAIALAKAVIAGKAGPQSLVRKLVDSLPFESVGASQTITYSFDFQNYGGIAAQNAVLSDTFPAGVTPSVSSLQLNGVPLASGVALAGQRLTVDIGSVAPATAYRLTISASIAPGFAIGSEAINTASIAASNASTVGSTPAAVLSGAADIVYDGNAGSSLPVAGAVVSLVDATTAQPLALGGTAVAPNAADADPYTTGPSGAYAFGLGPQQIGPITYDLLIVAPGYRTRRIAVTLTPDPTGTYDAITLVALDGQPLAIPGGFALTAGPVTIPAIANLFGNLPLFRVQSIAISKEVDRTVASAGDRLVYTVTFSNVGVPLGRATLVDTLPGGVAYAPGTALVDGVHVEPIVAGRTLTWSVPALSARHTVVYATVVVPGITAGGRITNVATISASVLGAPAQIVAATATADTAIVSGIFTDRSVITGRVFVDRARDGWFHRGDVGIASVRIYLEDGESVTTDTNGRFSFPGVRPGLHVLKLDRATLPPGTRAYDVRDYDARKSTRRLVHGVFDGGVIEDVNFAIEATS